MKKLSLIRIIALIVCLLSVCTFSAGCVEIDDSTDTHITDTPQTSEPETEAPETEVPETDAPETDVDTGEVQKVYLADIPEYSGNAFVVINDNVPNFSASELKTTGYESYSDLDSLGRTGVALASVGLDTMPKENEERGSISAIKPSGWVQAKYSGISGGYLYNRCHLIGWQLSAENANKRNLLTGTRYFNVDGMLTFENMVADYIKETGNHVAYRITPIYDGDNLLASGVQMEAYSVEDKGEGICFNVFCYNVQPGITIDYATGQSSGTKQESTTQQGSSTTTTQKDQSTSNNQATSQNNTSTNQNTQQNQTTTPTPEPNTNTTITVYIPKTGEKYHSKPNCGRMKNGTPIDKADAIQSGYGPCGTCY